CTVKKAISRWRLWPYSSAWAFALSNEMTISPRAGAPPSPAVHRACCGPGGEPGGNSSPSSSRSGNARTSVGPSMPRYSRLGRRISSSPVTTTLTSAALHPSLSRARRQTRVIRSTTSPGLISLKTQRMSTSISIGTLRPPGLHFADHRLGVLDALVVNPRQHFDKGLADLVEISQGDVAFVQLPVGQVIFDNLAHQSFDAARRRPAERPGRRFDAVGQEDDRRLF